MSNRKWSEIRGALPPLDEDAQHYVSRSRNESRIVGYRGRKGTKYNGNLHAPLLDHVTPDGRCVYTPVECYDPIDCDGNIVPCDVDENGNWVEETI